MIPVQPMDAGPGPRRAIVLPDVADHDGAETLAVVDMFPMGLGEPQSTRHFDMFSEFKNQGSAQSNDPIYRRRALSPGLK